MFRTFAIFSAHYLPHVGGVEVFTDNLARELCARGDEVVVVTNALEQDAGWTKVSGKLRILRLPCLPLFKGRLPLPVPSIVHRNFLRELDEIRFDAVVVNTRFYPHSLLGASVARKNGLAPIVIDHGSDYLTFGNALVDPFVRLYEHGITKVLRRYGPQLYGISEKSAQWLKTFGVSALGVVPNGLNAAKFRSAASSRSFREELGISQDWLLVAYTGRLIPEKGISALMEAASNPMLQERNVHFVLAGEGPMAADIESELLPNVHLVGRLCSNDVAALLSEADVFCFPSRSEGFGSSLLEAAACEAALVTTDVGIAASLVGDNEGGVLLSSGGSAGIVEALANYLDSPERLQSAKHCAADRAENAFSWEASVRALDEAVTRSAC